MILTSLGIILAILASPVVGLFLLYLYLRWFYGEHLVRIFQEKPLFVIPRGKPVEGAEDVRFLTSDNLELSGCYLRTTADSRAGVILFGPEFGSNRWSCHPYCEQLLAAGFDVFAFEPRSQGESDSQPGYESLQWVTHYDVQDVQAALAYLKRRADADPRGVGFFGISKGGSAGLIAAAADPCVRCFVTDGIYATYPTMVPYMRKWITIYSNQLPQRFLQQMLPSWYYEWVARRCIGRLQRRRGCRYLDLEKVIHRLAPRPLLMIHGGSDTYIKPDMAQELFARARQPKQFWLVQGAKHNQAIQIATAEYHRRICEFFETHLAAPKRAARAFIADGDEVVSVRRRPVGASK